MVISYLVWRWSVKDWPYPESAFDSKRSPDSPDDDPNADWAIVTTRRRSTHETGSLPRSAV